MRKIVLSAALLTLPLAACTSTFDAREGEMTPDAGQAVQHNIAAQLVNPNAPTDRGPFVTDGERAYQAIDRYSKGKVTPPSSASVASKSNGSMGDDTSDDTSPQKP